MTVATELGDKTFMIAAVLAMRYNRALVFAGAAAALLVMTVLSVAIGVAVPALLPRVYTHYAAGALFAYFGAKLLHEARAAPASGGGEHGELAEAEAELREGGLVGAGAATPAADEEAGGGGGEAGRGGGGGGAGGGDESGRGGAGGAEGGARAGGGGAAERAPSVASSGSEDDPEAKTHAGKRAAAGAVDEGNSLARDWPILTQAFTITFLAEWGDRSQIATIAMAAAQDPVGSEAGRARAGRARSGRLTHPTPPPSPRAPAVCIGSMVAHSFCTGLAVVGGRLLAARISERTVAFAGGCLFLLFAAHSFYYGPENLDA